MEDGHIVGFEEVGGVLGGPGVDGASCVAYLVVCDQVDCAADLVVRGFAEAEAFHYDSLGADCGISMDLYVEDSFFAEEVLLGAGFAHGDWVLGLEVGGVVDHGDFELFLPVGFGGALRDVGDDVIDGVG